MRILEVVPVVSTQGRFGGPVTVAVEQAAELTRRGHEVFLAAVWDGPGEPPQTWASLPLISVAVSGLSRRLPLPLWGASGLPRMVAQAGPFDVVHLHCGRHRAALRLARLARRHGWPVVVQSHGMLPAAGPLLTLFDRALTAPSMSRATRHYSLTPQEDLQVSAFSERFATPAPTRLRNGLDARQVAPAARPQPPTVLFMARLHARKRPADFVRAAQLLVAEGVRARFVVRGPDGGELDRLRTMMDQGWELGSPVPPQHVNDVLRQATLLILPSADEPFPMTVLEAMRAGACVVITAGCGIAAELEGQGAAVVVPVGDVPALAAAVRSLLADPDRRLSLQQAGQRSLENTFSIGKIVDQLESDYADL